MNQETSTQTRVLNNAFGRPPKGERRVRFADTMGMELVSIFLFELINEYFHNQDSRTRRHQLKLMGHSHNSSNHHSQISSKQMNGNNQLKLNSSNYYNSSDSGHNQPLKAASNNSYNKSSTNTTTSIYQTHDSSTHAASYFNNNSNTTSSNTYNTYNNNNNNSTLNNNYNYNHSSTNNNTSNTAKPLEPSYICEFTQPVSLLSFKERVKLNKVHLETCQINSTAGHVSVSCTIRVLNLSYDKSVIVRYTTDDWRTHTDSLASYKPGSSDGWSDRFTSTFTVTNQVQSFQAGQRVIFAIRCLFDGSNAHWDNNGGLNYAIRRQQ